MLKDSQATLNNDVLEDGTRRNVDCAVFRRNNDDSTLEDDATAEVDITSNSEMIKFDNVGNAADTLLELSNLLEVGSELDERSWAESVGIHDELAMAESVEV